MSFQPTGVFLRDAIDTIIRERYPELRDERLPFVVDIPEDLRFGDSTTNAALIVSKRLKQSPREIAQNIIPALKDDLEQRLPGDVREIRCEGAGFINFYFSEGFFQRHLLSIVREGAGALRTDLGKGARVLIEFVSANPTGPLSVAHARQAAVGDILANVFDFAGYDVQREYYLNDEGNQINILGRSLALRIKELKGEAVDFPEDHYQGEYIYDIARAVIEKKLDIEDPATYAADYILTIIKKELEDFGVSFDTWYSQKALGAGGAIEKVFEELRTRGYLYDEGNAVWFKSTAFGDDKDRVVVKSDGSLTYLAPDIAYHKDKFARGFTQLINLWGPDHHGYINRLKASVAALDNDAQALSIVIVQLATIFREGKPVQMSTRKGQYITLREVLDEVGRDASRYFFIMRRTSAHLDFDLDVAKKQTSENPVYYVQYAYARIAGILRAAPGAGRMDADTSLLKEKEELQLIKKLTQFPSIIEICVKTLDPYMLTVYLAGVAERFHKFYDLHRVLGQEEALTQARLALLDATKTVIAAGLGLIGVSQPEKM